MNESQNVPNNKKPKKYYGKYNGHNKYDHKKQYHTSKSQYYYSLRHAKKKKLETSEALEREPIINQEPQIELINSAIHEEELNNDALINEAILTDNHSNKRQHIFIGIIISICIIGLLYSFINILIWKKDNNATNKEIEFIQNFVEVNNNTSNNTDIQLLDLYWDFTHENFLDVDFSALKKINKDVIGWIEVPGTNINYPFVQTSDNEYYLKRSFEKKYNRSGWIFMDYRNNINNFDQNNIIYGHALQTKAMFGSLSNTLKKDWFNNKDNHFITTYTENNTYIWEVFSIYIIPNTTDYLDTNFSSDEEYQDFIKLITDRSKYNFNNTPTVSDKILTLSTCYNNSKSRVVLHAKLLNIETKNEISN